ncbi:helix-turn-helix domain-containing protein [Pasteurellaceae bacterium 22721_9_1]
MCIAKRLKDIIESQSLSIKAFADKTEIPYRSVQSYLLGERSPSAEILIKVTECFGINANWLLLGEGEMFAKNTALSKQEMQLLHSYSQCSDDVKRKIMVAINAIALDSVEK